MSFSGHSSDFSGLGAASVFKGFNEESTLIATSEHESALNAQFVFLC